MKLLVVKVKGHDQPVACTDFLRGRCEKKGTLMRVLAPMRAVYHVFNQPRGQFSVFCLPRGHFNACLGSQEGTLMHVSAPKRAL